GAAGPGARSDPGEAGAAAARGDHRDGRVHDAQGARARAGARGERARVGGAAPMIARCASTGAAPAPRRFAARTSSALGLVRARVRARRWTVAAATAAVFVVYQTLILVVLVAGLGGPPNYVR